MQTYISILRGINVSGHKIIKMESLKKTFEKSGFKNVKTYIQSGNVIFNYKETSCKLLESKISSLIVTDFGFEVPIIVIEKTQFEKIYTNNDFIISFNKDINFLHVTFLSEKPKQADIKKISGDFGSDEFIFSGATIYLFCPNGYGNTKLNNNFFETKLKLTATTRNWKTVTALKNIVSTED